ncbi:trichohyalin [Aplysia californica]|uniref:Trichohyalin n=1 Tax=Aplysia californica TaxID=6500 RepID=A0ABM1AE58_APLCA|nr:trichohyalin [Aplysia californica]
MSLAEKISEPHGGETPDVLGWRRSLRSPSPGGQKSSRSQDGVTFSCRSRSPSPAQFKVTGEKSLRSRSRSPKVILKVAQSVDGPRRSTMKKSSIANGLRKSTGSSLTADLSMSGKLNKTTGELGNIEAEYIKNLQQQIYFLELEANYLREQARKATEMHPQMTNEAENMLAKLREMQSDIDKMDTELKRKDSSIGVHTSEKQRLEELLQLEKENRGREKRLYSEELVTMKKEKDRLQTQVMRKDDQLLEAKGEVEKSLLALKSAETKISTLKAQLEQRIEQHNLTQLSLEEKRTELLSTSTQLREVEERYLASTVTIQDKLAQDLRDEIRMLHQKVKESELGAEKDKFLRNKVTEDMDNLVRENSSLNQQIVELSRQLERERELRDSTDQRHARSISEIATLKEQLQENDLLRSHLKNEKEKGQQYLEQLTSHETSSKSVELQVNSLRSQLREAEGMKGVSDSENAQLRKDKTMLIDRVAELTQQIEERDREIHTLRTDVDSLGSRFKSLDLQKSVELGQQLQKWEEFAHLAESMKNLSQTMISQASTSARSPRHAPQQY